jgi:hypothetical protein
MHLFGFSTIWLELIEAPLAAVRCYAIAFVMGLGIFLSRGMSLHSSMEPLGTGLILFGAAWVVFKLRMKPDHRGYFKQKTNHNLSADEPRDLDLTAAELCEALLTSARFAAQGATVILVGGLLLVLNLLTKLS